MSTNVTKPLLADSFIDLATLTASTEDASHADDLAVDNDRDTYWESEGSDDVTAETFELDFGQTVDVDFMALIGINLKAFIFQYWTGAAWSAFTSGTFTGHTNDYAIVKESASVQTDKVRIYMTTTQVADSEKQISEILFGEVLLETWYDEFRDRDVDKAGHHRLAEKGNMDSWYEWRKRGWEIRLDHKSLSEVAILRTLKDDREEFIWYPEPEMYPDQVFLTEWMNRWDRRYSAKTKAPGSTLRLQLEEK